MAGVPMRWSARTETGRAYKLLPTADKTTETHRVETFRLPPLILHPFSTPDDASVLMQSSRASLALQGFLPVEEGSAEDLDRRLLRGRYAELRMLYYIGKDLTRWMEQCAEMTAALFTGRRIRP